jgi:hypothetical protein
VTVAKLRRGGFPWSNFSEERCDGSCRPRVASISPSFWQEGYEVPSKLLITRFSRVLLQIVTLSVNFLDNLTWAKERRLNDEKSKILHASVSSLISEL